MTVSGGRSGGGGARGNGASRGFGEGDTEDSGFEGGEGGTAGLEDRSLPLKSDRKSVECTLADNERKIPDSEGKVETTGAESSASSTEGDLGERVRNEVDAVVRLERNGEGVGGWELRAPMRLKVDPVFVGTGRFSGIIRSGSSAADELDADGNNECVGDGSALSEALDSVPPSDLALSESPDIVLECRLD